MPPVPPSVPPEAIPKLPAEVLEAFQRYRAKGDASAVEALVIAAAVDYRPAGTGPAGAVCDSTRLVEDMGYDSVAVAELIFFIEDLLEMTISNEEILTVATIGDLRACVARKLAAKSGAA